MSRVLILFAHPRLHHSRVHKKLLPIANSKEHVSVHDLYAAYPDEFIFADKEQRLLDKHDVILMQFPFYWFSVPGILKSWQDIVLRHGYAFGDGGNALDGKIFATMTSTGGHDYLSKSDSFYRFAVRDYLISLESMALLCGMTYLPPFVIHDSRRISDERLSEYCDDYSYYLDCLENYENNLSRWRGAININSVLYTHSQNKF